jgi:integrase
MASGTRLRRARSRAGAQITWLSRHLGHSSLKVTTDIYGHWERAERKLQAAKMEEAFPCESQPVLDPCWHTTT